MKLHIDMLCGGRLSPNLYSCNNSMLLNVCGYTFPASVSPCTPDEKYFAQKAMDFDALDKEALKLGFYRPYKQLDFALTIICPSNIMLGDIIYATLHRLSPSFQTSATLFEGF